MKKKQKNPASSSNYTLRGERTDSRQEKAGMKPYMKEIHVRRPYF